MNSIVLVIKNGKNFTYQTVDSSEPFKRKIGDINNLVKFKVKGQMEKKNKRNSVSINQNLKTVEQVLESYSNLKLLKIKIVMPSQEKEQLSFLKITNLGDNLYQFNVKKIDESIKSISV